MARPTEYTPEMGELMFIGLAAGKSLREVCADEQMPDPATIYRWLASEDDAYKGFREQYTRARDAQADFYADEILEISDDGRNDWMERRSEAEKGAGVETGWVLNGEHVQRSRLRVDSRKWVASKLKPKKYGDKLATEISGPEGGPVQTVTEVKVTIVDPGA